VTISTDRETISLATVKVHGRLDALQAPALRQEIAKQLAAGEARLIVDLSAIEFVDSAGLAALVKGLKDARSAGGDLRLVRPRAEDAMRVFKLTRFDEVFMFLDSAADGATGW